MDSALSEINLKEAGAATCSPALTATKRGGWREGAGRPPKKRLSNLDRGQTHASTEENLPPTACEARATSGSAGASASSHASVTGPKVDLKWRHSKADRRRRRLELRRLREEEEARKEEEEARLKWEGLEKLCFQEILCLPGRSHLSRSQLVKVTMQLNCLAFFCQLMTSNLASKAYSFQLAAKHWKVSVKTVREWLQVFKLTDGKMLLEDDEEKASLSAWLLESEDLKKQAVAYVREHAIRSGAGEKNMSLDDFHQWVNTDLLPKTTGAANMRIGRSTAHTWLHQLGFRYKKAKKGIYVDGHDREDVVDFRNNVFLPNMAEVERRSAHYVGVATPGDDDGTEQGITVSFEHVDGFLWGDVDGAKELDRSLLGQFGGQLNPSVMLPCERPIILAVQDETVVRQYDCHKSYWGTEDMRMLVRKTDGRGLMFSGFLTEEVGIPVPTALQLAEINAKRSALGKPAVDQHCCLKQVDYTTEGWWNSDKILQQTDEVMDVLEHMFPEVQLAFMFDWSSGHHRYPEDALIPRHMNRGPGGKQPLMRSTTILRDEDAPLLGAGATQHLIFEDGDVVLATGKPAVAGTAKGAEQVLRERGLYVAGMTLNGGKKKDQAKSMVARLEKCVDMQGAKCLLEEMIEGRGHVCIFSPKFHCECSAIELLWGRGKFELRSRCDYSLESLRQNSVQAFLDVPLLTIRKFFRKARNYMAAYREGVNALAAESKVKKYKSHRRPAPSGFLHV